MLISVIIPTYKRSARLTTAIKSVLNQTYQHLEIIVVDDNGETEHRIKTKQSIQAFIDKKQITYLANKINKGGCAARNAGAFAANGQYIAFLDDDDFYEPTKLEKQLNLLKSNKSLDACACNMYRIDDYKNSILSRENEARGITLKETILDGNLFTSMLLIKKDVFVNLGGFSEISRFQDKYFHFKFLEQGYKIGILPESLLTLVEHNDYRISLMASKHIIEALNILHRFEKKHKELFTKKEWGFIKQRKSYNMAYTLCEGSFSQKIKALYYIAKSIEFANKKKNLFRLTMKALMPNKILNLKKDK